LTLRVALTAGACGGVHVACLYQLSVLHAHVLIGAWACPAGYVALSLAAESVRRAAVAAGAEGHPRVAFVPRG
jgi:hypothetical protein